MTRTRTIAACLASAMGETECHDCEGEGRIWNNADPTSGQSVDCDCCDGTGWREPTQKKINDMAELRPITAVVDMETTDRIDAECRAHLATLSPERRAYLEGEWK